MVFCTLNDIMDGAMAYPSALEALRRMPQIDSEHLDTKCPAAWIDMLYHFNWRQARAAFEEILSKRPSSFALGGLAAMYVAEGRILKAEERAWEAWRINPLVSSLGEAAIYRANLAAALPCQERSCRTHKVLSLSN